MNKIIAIAAFAAILFPAWLSADDDLDAQLFQDTNTVVESSKVVSTEALSNADGNALSFSGSMLSRTSYAMTKDWVTGASDWTSNRVNTYIQGSFMLDARLQKALKAFVSADLSYYPLGQIQSYNPYSLVYNFGTGAIATNTYNFLSTNTTVFNLREIWVDLNIEKAVYFKVGKQVLQWGTTFFFTPNDLVNVDHKSFGDLNRGLSGTYGVKMTVPFGTAASLYGWIDGSGSILNLDDPAVAVKAEALLAGWEFSLSGWGKKGKQSVYGFDFSGRIPWINLNLYGEASLSYGQNAPMYQFSNFTVVSNAFTNIAVTNLSPYYITNEFVPKIVIGFSRSFEVMDVADRLSVTGEFYYNYSGYSNNMFQTATNVITNQLQQQLAIAQMYSPNNYGQYYAALFVSYAQFLHPDMTLSANAIGNLSDMSFAGSLGLSYAAVDRFTLSGSVTGFYSQNIGEYTWSGNAINAQMDATLAF